jgi:hypothetical protein
MRRDPDLSHGGFVITLEEKPTVIGEDARLEPQDAG